MTQEEKILNKRKLYPGQLVLLHYGFFDNSGNGTGITENYCYVDEVIDEEKRLYLLKEIKQPKKFDKSVTQPRVKQYDIEDLDVKAMLEKMENGYQWFAYVDEIEPKDVELFYGKPWKEILEHDTNLNKKKMWRRKRL